MSSFCCRHGRPRRIHGRDGFSRMALRRDAPGICSTVLYLLQYLSLPVRDILLGVPVGVKLNDRAHTAIQATIK